MTIIYALKRSDIIIYIGQTIDIKRRMYQHSLNVNLSGVTHVILEECEDKIGLSREKYYIKKYMAEGYELINKTHSKDNKIDEIDLEILQLLANDMKTKEMQPVVWLSHRTIETRIHHIKKKLRVKRIGGLIRSAYNKGFIK